MSERKEADVLGELIEDETLTRTGRSIGTVASGHVADAILAAGYRKVSADPDTVERVAEAIHAESCGCNAQSGALVGEWHQLARAAINAIGGGGDG